MRDLEFKAQKETSQPTTWFGEPQDGHIAGMIAIAKTLYLDEATLNAIAHLDTTLSTPKLQAQYGEETTSLIKSFQALEATRSKAAGGQAETLRKMLLAFSQDIRVVIMYLASRLKTLRWVTQEKLSVPHAWSAELLEIDASISRSSADQACGTESFSCVTHRRVLSREAKYIITTRMSCENAKSILRNVSACPPAALLRVASNA